MHAFIEADMGDKPALQPRAAIGPAVRAIAGHIIDTARATITDPERSNQDAVHDFRRAMKQWRALMRLLEPFIPDAVRLRQEARDHARSLARARDGQSALNAFDDLVDKGMALSARSIATIRGRLEAIRGSEEQEVLTPELRQAIIAWLDATTAAIELWPLDPFEFSAIAARLTAGYRAARRCIPADWVERQCRRPASSAPARRRSPLSDGFDRAAVAAPRPHVDRGSRTAARPARPLPGPGDPQAAHRAASAAGALALAADAGLRRTHHGAGAPRRPHRATACSPNGPRRSAIGWKRCGSTGGSARSTVARIE